MNDNDIRLAKDMHRALCKASDALLAAAHALAEHGDDAAREAALEVAWSNNQIAHFYFEMTGAIDDHDPFELMIPMGAA